MTILVRTLVGAAIATASVSAAAQVVPRPGSPPLWSGLRVGMSAQQVADQLTQNPEIASVSFKPAKEGYKFNIKYRNGGIEIARLRFKLTPEFVRDRLSSVELTSGDNLCASDTVNTIEKFKSLVQDKYPQNVSVTRMPRPSDIDLLILNYMQNAKGNLSDFRNRYVQVGQAFTNGTTQIDIGVLLTMPFMSKGLPMNYSSQYATCKSDYTTRARVVLDYRDRATVAASEDGERQRKSEKNKSDADKL